jgi:hypothetical protein
METIVADFSASWALAHSVPGWLTESQAARLFSSAAALAPGSTIVEIGSHQGRSTLVLAQAAASDGGSVTAIDPFIEGRLFGGLSTREKFERNLAAGGVHEVVTLVPRASQDVRTEWTAAVDLLYIDGKHDFWTVSDDLKWADLVPPGGEVFIHDAFSSIGVTLGILRHVLPSSSLRYVDRTGSLARLEVGRPSARDRARILAELPWWFRNVLIKIVLRVGRLFGHTTTPDPY